MLPVSKEIVVEELEASQRYLSRLLEKIRVGFEYPYDQTGLSAGVPQQELLIREMCAELKIVGARCESLAEIVIEALTGV